QLLPAMLPEIDLPRALLRGRYMAAAARMEWTGVPIDTDIFHLLREQWLAIKGRLVASVNADYGVFVPAGQRTINPDSTLGSAILGEAEAWGINPYHLADAVDLVWAEERQSTAEIHEARRAARRLTGLSTRQLNLWEEAGGDYSTFPGLDDTARE